MTQSTLSTDVSYLVTGTAGFIGFHVAKKLLEQGACVVGVDCLTDYYDVKLKEARLAELKPFSHFQELRLDLSEPETLARLKKDYPDIGYIIHLAAQPGVRYSIERPEVYTQHNLVAHNQMLEYARFLQQRGSLRRCIYASSSSVYGGNEKVPFSEEDRCDHPISLYAATKRANELVSDTYHHLYGISLVGLRFFTVYGPWGRPDMALYSFTESIMRGKPIRVFNQGKMQRDFTYIDDIVAGVIGAVTSKKIQGHQIYNLGNHTPEELLTFIETIEQALGKKAVMDFQPMQPGDVPRTFADVSKAAHDLGYQPTTPISVGIPAFVEWYLGR